ncbi:MAG: hypothetical protein FWG50_09425 [Kiritimatiellaeota bacterium]|nr:hypothetical protein [Kiritimatiellota bacterium]
MLKWEIGLGLVLACWAMAALAQERYPWNDARVTYKGAWHEVTFGGADGEYGLFAMRGDAAGASVEMAFVGTAVGLAHQAGGLGWEWGVVQEDTGRPLGSAEVWVDGKRVSVINTSENGRTWLAQNLPMGEHHVRVVNAGTGAIVVKGFFCDALSGDPEEQELWRYAAGVRGGKEWRRLASAFLKNRKGGLKLVYEESRKTEEVISRLHAIQTEPPHVPMTEIEKRYWMPNAETTAYLSRLAQYREIIQEALQESDEFISRLADSIGDTRILGLTIPPRPWVTHTYLWALDSVEKFFAEETKRLPPVIFYTGAPLRSGAVPNYIWQGQPLDNRFGCSIRIFDPSAPDAAAKVIFAEEDSVIMDLELSFDARTVFFSMRRHRAPCWHIYEIGVDGRGLRQITEGLHHNVSPAPLADGRIAFISSRTPGYHTVCQSGPATHVHTMARDGSDVRRLSSNTLTDFNLSALRDGRLLFTRWEYVDTTLTYRQGLWTQHPDGRQFQLWYGNTLVDPATICQAREVPGRYCVVATFAPHHHSPRGAIGLVTNRSGPEAPRNTGIRWITREFPAVVDHDFFWAYCDPYPVSENRFLVSYGGGGAGRFRIFLLDEMDNKALVYDDPATSCFGAKPLLPRPAPAALPDLTASAPATVRVPAAPPGQPQEEDVALGYLMVTDVYSGLAPHVARGRVKTLRIMEQLPKTMNRTWNPVLDQGPLMSAATYYAKRVWGYAPVEDDGSAYFEAPALKEIYLQACDAEGRELQRMTSALNLMPGETQSCAGCHENRQTSPAAPRQTLAAQRSPSALTLPAWGNAGILDYTRVIQPVLDRTCVECHQGTAPPKGILLTGDHTRFFCMSYDNLVLLSRSDDVSRARYTGRGDALPLTQGIHLLWGTVTPYAPLTSGSHASRIPAFFRREHCKKDVPPDDLRRIHEWLDAMLPYYATADHAHLQAKGNRDKWADKDKPDLLPWYTERFAPAYERRCAACHKDPLRFHGGEWHPLWSWVNLTRPEWSPALTAHLAKSAGGRGIPAEGFAFGSTDDPDYRLMLDALREARGHALATPEADMAGFTNRAHNCGEFRY